MPDTKKPWQSKTYWANILSALLIPLLPHQDQSFLNAHPFIVPYALIGMNMVLRHFTHGKVSLE